MKKKKEKWYLWSKLTKGQLANEYNKLDAKFAKNQIDLDFANEQVNVLNSKSSPTFCLNTWAPVPTLDAVFASAKQSISIKSPFSLMVRFNDNDLNLLKLIKHSPVKGSVVLSLKTPA